MTLVDTSAWVEFLRATGSRVHRLVQTHLEQDSPLHTTDVVVMEVLAGARDDDHRERLRRLLGRCDYLAIDGLREYESAADLYRNCRGAGETVRSLTDCLIAVVAMRESTPVLHFDQDFDALARHSDLQVQSL